MLEKRLQKLESRIERFKQIEADSLINLIEKAWDVSYIVNIGGTLIRRYQKPRAEQLGWEEKDLTIRNSVYGGILPAMGYVVLNQFLGDNISESFQTQFYFYPAFMFTVGH